MDHDRSFGAVGVAKSYGGVHALRPFTADFEQGTVTAVVGPNGAGKTTLIDCLSGRTPVDRGHVVLNGERIEALGSQRRARLGIARTFQDATQFPSFTVRETLTVAGDRMGAHLAAGDKSPTATNDLDRLVDETLERFNLVQVHNEIVSNLSLGMSRVVSIASLHVSGADVWLLDEPASGLARAEVRAFGALLRSLARDGRGKTIVMVEHDAQIVEAAADRVLLLEGGELIADAAAETPEWDSVMEGRSSLVARMAAELTAEATAVGPVGDGDTLTASSLEVSYGRFVAVRGVDIEARAGEIRCLVGTNGAGKSSIMRCFGGLLQPSAGVLRVGETELSGPAFQRVREYGIVLVEGGRSVFPHLTVSENLRLGARRASKSRLAFELFPELEERQKQRAGTLSSGEQQMLAIARALITRPRFLLVDELTLGLAGPVANRVLEGLNRLCVEDGIGVLLVEQDYALALRWSTHAHVLAQGELIFSGAAAEAAQRPDLFRPVFMPEEI